MDLVFWQFFESLGLMLGGFLFLTRVIPELRRFATAVQIALFLYTGLRGYLKKRPEKAKDMKRFVAQIVDHYIHTHPEGKKVAKETNLDENVRNLFLEELNNLDKKLT